VYEMDNERYQCLHEMDLTSKLVKLRAEKALDDALMKQTQKFTGECSLSIMFLGIQNHHLVFRITYTVFKYM